MGTIPTSQTAADLALLASEGLTIHDSDDEDSAPDPLSKTNAGLVNYPRPRLTGLDFDTWKHLVNVASIVGRMGEPITAENIKEYSPQIDIDLITKVLGTNEFAAILEYRGVLDDQSPVGLTERQMMTLNLVTNFSDLRPLRTKLKSIGVTHSEFQQWLSTSGRFKRVFRKLSEQLFDEAQGAVNIALTSEAVKGDIRAIKYFNEVSGRHDPATRNIADVKQVLSAVVDAVSSTVKDPQILAEITAKLSAIMVSSGLAQGSSRLADAFSGNRELT